MSRDTRCTALPAPGRSTLFHECLGDFPARALGKSPPASYPTGVVPAATLPGTFFAHLYKFDHRETLIFVLSNNDGTKPILAFGSMANISEGRSSNGFIIFRAVSDGCGDARIGPGGYCSKCCDN